MRTLPHQSSLAVVAGIAIGAGTLLGFGGWLEPHRPLEFAGLILAAIGISAFAMQPSTAEDRARMPASFVIEFTSLLLFGPGATMLVALAGTLTHAAAHSQRPHAYRQTLVNAVTAVVAIQTAGLAHRALGGTMGHFTWPSQGVPIAAAVVVYYFVKSASANVITPLLAKQPFSRSWGTRFLQECPTYFIGAGLAVGLVEVIDHRIWGALPGAAVPMYFAHRAYCDYASRLDDEQRRREVIDALDQGMAVVDSNGRVTLWNDALERIVGCPRDRALGRSLVSAVPALNNTELPRAIAEAFKDRSPRTLSHLGLPSAAGPRILQVKVLPVAGGVTLLWHDVTERRRDEHALKRSEERLALAAEGANDGLWECNLRTQEFYFSSRWRAMIGLPAAGGIGRPEEWIDRVHPDDVAGLKEALKAHVSGTTEHFQHEHRVRHEDGTYRWFLCRGVAAPGAGRRPVRIAGSLTDTTDRVIAQERLRSAGFLDPLTGLPNRADFVEGLGRRLDEFKQRRRDERFAVLYLDLDRFKVVNDSLGHLVGDELLVAVSRRLESCLREGDSLARLGGDEFAILLNQVGDEQQAKAVAFRIQKVLSAPLQVGGREVFTSASIGIAFGQAQYTNPDGIMRDADTAMYHAKAHGKARHELFDADMRARTRDRLGLESDLRHAVDGNDFEVHYQPIVSLASGMCVGFESLIRWTRNGEAVSPATFIPMAEELGLIEPVGTWVLEQACHTFADWQRRFPDGGLEYITVNVSSRQLMQHNFLSIVEQAVHKTGLKPCDLRLEITETALMDSPNSAAEVLRDLRNFGVKIYLDDFGTGFSSLSHLHKLPVDALKIDRSFVRSLELPDRPAIVESILALARTLNTSVVAEGIETDVQARELERLGCTHAQGFLFSRPLSTRTAEELLRANQALGPKRVQASVAGTGNEPELYYSSKPFEWPEHIPVRPAAGPASTPPVIADLLRA
jgi:diguanylate cyclase (GGDEF)-like protein/PAS domain S-box-containing protein